MALQELTDIDYAIHILDMTIADLYKRKAALEALRPKAAKAPVKKRKLPDPRVLRGERKPKDE